MKSAFDAQTHSCFVFVVCGGRVTCMSVGLRAIREQRESGTRQEEQILKSRFKVHLFLSVDVWVGELRVFMKVGVLKRCRGITWRPLKDVLFICVLHRGVMIKVIDVIEQRSNVKDTNLEIFKLNRRLFFTHLQSVPWKTFQLSVFSSIYQHIHSFISSLTSSLKLPACLISLYLMTCTDDSQLPVHVQLSALFTSLVSKISPQGPVSWMF